jgi:hypothetical protein
MAIKDDSMILKLAEDVDFLRKYIVHPNKELEFRLRDVEQVNKKLKEIVKILAEDRLILKQELVAKTSRLGGCSERIKMLEERMIHREALLSKLSQKAKDQQEIIVSLRNEKIGLEIGDKEKNQKIDLMTRRVLADTHIKVASINKMNETRAVLEKQVELIKREKNSEFRGKKELQERLEKILPIIDKQSKLLETSKQEFELKIAELDKRHKEQMARLSQSNIKELIESKTAVAELTRKLMQVQSELDKRKQKEENMVSKISEKLKEVLNEN